MKITIYLSNGQTEYTSNKTLQEIIYEIYELFPDNLGFKIAKEELSRAIYLSECSRSAGIRAINEDKAEWLSILIRNAEQYRIKEDERKW